MRLKEAVEEQKEQHGKLCRKWKSIIIMWQRCTKEKIHWLWIWPTLFGKCSKKVSGLGRCLWFPVDSSSNTLWYFKWQIRCSPSQMVGFALEDSVAGCTERSHQIISAVVHLWSKKQEVLQTAPKVGEQAVKCCPGSELVVIFDGAEKKERTNLLCHISFLNSQLFGRCQDDGIGVANNVEYLGIGCRNRTKKLVRTDKGCCRRPKEKYFEGNRPEQQERRPQLRSRSCRRSKFWYVSTTLRVQPWAQAV